MKIKVVREIEMYGYGSISDLVGNEYEVKEKQDDRVMIHVPEWGGDASIFNEEYEVVEE